MSHFFLPLLILAYILFCTPLCAQVSHHESNSIVEPVVVHIISRVPGSLRFHCKSKDDDLGSHTSSNGQEFKWKFIPNIFRSTLFFCHFYWNSKQQIFDVYNKDIDPDCDNSKVSFDFQCYWEARPDGFYLSNDNQTWKKRNNWA
ncbi:hypothetical protein Vadar_021519 [Vaccinium darrowii]|uniref:Uncharacterized protein n=1 Tax=Vaccinium darrowii TaxID=229202 RepID=A0ACB7X310_9ERIC|nr:hypothetical protein Vadar_021519 [Vaccinium darrowii]